MKRIKFLSLALAALALGACSSSDDVAEGGGNSIDVSTREKHIAGNVYSAANPYGDVTISDEIENMANLNTYYLS